MSGRGARLHATCVAIMTEAGPLAVLLRGPSGAGKSDLALRLIDAGAALVADDQVEVLRSEGRLIARAPARLAGALEVRGLGICEVPRLPQAPLGLAVDLVAGEPAERLPEERSVTLCGIELPLLVLDPAAPATPAKLRLAARARASALQPPPARRWPARADESAPEPRTEPRAAASPLPLVLVTGLSGAGRTLALKTLEDIGYEAIDNLPLHLLERAVEERSVDRPLAVGADIRNRDFAAAPLLSQLDELVANPALSVRLLFLDCEDEVLQQRFTATRRRHPLAEGRPLADGIAAERRLVVSLRDRADHVVDTSQLSPHDLRRVLSGMLALADTPKLGIFVTSFSFRRGLPREADLVLDVRFLRNPYYQEELRLLTGREPRVAAFIEADSAFGPFFESFTAMLGPLLPRYEAEGKSYLTIAIGCTGGRHRSVAVAERLAAWLAAHGRPAALAHRDLADHDAA